MKSPCQTLLTQRTDGDSGEDDVLYGDLQHRGGGGLVRPVAIIITIIIIAITLVWPGLAAEVGHEQGEAEARGDNAEPQRL